jgi:hypothetical protein
MALRGAFWIALALLALVVVGVHWARGDEAHSPGLGEFSPSAAVESPSSSPAAIVPDPTLTPGAVRTTDVSEFCANDAAGLGHWSRERDDRIMVGYGLPPGPHPDYEVDHLNPLGIGGASPLTVRSEIEHGSRNASACSDGDKTMFGLDFVVCVDSKRGAALAGFRLSPYYEYGLYLEGIWRLPVAFGYPRGPNTAARYWLQAFTRWSNEAATIAKTYGLAPRDFCNATQRTNLEACLADLAKGAP